MTKWLSENGPWIIPLAAIVGTAITVVYRLWQMSKIKDIDISSTPLRKRTVRICILLQSTGWTLLCIAPVIFALLPFSLPFAEAGATKVPGVLFFTSLGFAVAGAIVLFIGKLGHEWFRD